MKNIKVMDLRVFFLPNLSQDNKIFFNHLRYELHAPETKILQTSIDTLDYKNKYQSTRDKTDSRLSYIIRYVISVHLKSVQKCRSSAIWRFYIFSLSLYREYQVANLPTPTSTSTTSTSTPPATSYNYFTNRWITTTTKGPSHPYPPTSPYNK